LPYVPNAELALMFIPVQLRQNISAPGLVLVDLYLESWTPILVEVVSHISLLGGVLFGFSIMWYGRRISLMTIGGKASCKPKM
jgi:hypothetical protein